MTQYIIVGDTENHLECLVKICLGANQKQAEAALELMLTTPTENDLRLMRGHRNLRVKAVEGKQWWDM